MEPLLQQMEELYHRDRLFAAYALYQQHEQELKEKETIPFIQNLKKEVARANQLRNEFNNYNTNDWQLVQDKDEIRTFYQHFSNTPHHAIKLEATIASNMINILAIFYEIDLYPKWVYAMRDANILQSFSSDYRFLCYYSWNLPFPFYNRDCICHGIGIDCIKEDNSILVLVQTPLDNEFPPEIIPPLDTKKCVRMECHYAGFYIQWINEHTTLVKIICNIDPKLSHIPIFLQNLATKHASYYVMSMLSKLAKQIEKDEEYQQRIKEKQHIYGDIITRINNR